MTELERDFMFSLSKFPSLIFVFLVVLVAVKENLNFKLKLRLLAVFITNILSLLLDTAALVLRGYLLMNSFLTIHWNSICTVHFCFWSLFVLQNALARNVLNSYGYLNCRNRTTNNGLVYKTENCFRIC